MNMIGDSSNGNNQVAKVRRDKLLPCLTCPLCQKLIMEATTINECLHSFCKKCIYEKIIDEDLDSCPVCNTSLGCTPLDKLRNDHQLQELRTKLFPLDKEKSKQKQTYGVETKKVVKTSNTNAPAPLSAPTSPTKRKEKSLTALVLGLPTVTNQTVTTRRRSKSVPRKVGPNIAKDISSSKEPIERVQSCSKNKVSSEQAIQNAGPKTQFSQQGIKGDSNKSKSTNAMISSNQSPQEEASLSILNKDDEANYKAKAKGKAIAYENDDVQVHHHHEDMFKLANLGPSMQEEQSWIYKLRAPTNGHTPLDVERPGFIIGPTTKRPQEIVTPIWFSLLASQDCKGGTSPLPQISPSYLRVKDVNVPVSIIMKYIAKKLNLADDSKVEIMIHGHSVVPVLRLRNLLDIWIQTSPRSQDIRTFVGSSAEDFLMILTYAART